MALVRLVAGSMTLLALSACAELGIRPPTIAYDDGDFRPAAAQPEAARPVQVVTIPEPLPLPGQLQPLPQTAKAEAPPPTDRVDAANAAALQEPTARGYVNAIQVYPFTEGALYRLYAAPEHVTDIALQPGETLVAISAGDTVRWVVGDTTSGTGLTKQSHVLVKPIAAALRTNLVITTDRHTYHLQLESTESTFMAAVSWTYPHETLITLQRANDGANAADPVAAGVALESLRFRYEITGDSPPWRPLRAFDDGTKVYVEFPSRIDQGEAPPLFVVGPSGDNQLVNYRVRGNYYVVDRLFAAAELRLGQDPQHVVRINRTDGAPAGTAPRRAAR